MSSLLALLKALKKTVSNKDEKNLYRFCPIVNSAGEFSDLKDQEIVFLITPGRSGTKTLIQYLQRNSDLFAIHAPTPWLATVGSLFWKNEVGVEGAKWAYYSSRESYLQMAYEMGLTFVDGDCKNLPLLPALADFFPNSKFVHVLRNPVKFVCSGLDRGYYTEKDAILWGHLLNDPQVFKANSFKQQVELISDFWESSNKIAEDIKNKVGSSRYVLLKSESMFSDGAQIYKTFDYLGIGKFNKVEKGNLSVMNNNKKRSVYNKDYIIDVLSSRCPSAKIYYPEIFS